MNPINLKGLFIIPILFAAAFTVAAYLFTNLYESDTIGFSSFETNILLAMTFVFSYLIVFLMSLLFTQFKTKRRKNEKLPASK